MLRKLIFTTFVIFLFLGWFNFVSAQSESVQITFFYSSTCPHCAKEEEFLKTLQQKYPEIKINSYEVVHMSDNQKILQEFYDKYKVPENEKGYVPVTFTSTKYFVGFNDQVAKDLENCLRECISGNKTVSEKIKIPFIGEIDASKVSLPLLTVILGTLDGFNPCAMWVLVVLISMLLSLKSRKKIALVGGVFIFAEGLLYFLFMSAWLNAFLVIGYVSITRILIGIFGIVFGIWRIRDFLTWKPGVCKVTEETKSQDKILQRINNVLKPAAVPATVLGVIVLAFGVNLVEFFCSAGFPVMFTRILTLQDVGVLQRYVYLLFYNFFYMLDDFIVFGFAFFTMNRYNFSDKYSRYSTLVAGLLILILGILLIFKPNILMFA
jgi:glutaredoxin